MMRFLVLVLPFAFLAPACASLPSGGSRQPEADPSLNALRRSTDPAAEVPGTWVTESPTGATAADVSASSGSDDGVFTDMDSRHITVLLGERFMVDHDWDPVDDQLAGGIQFDATDPLTGHGYEVGVTYSRDENNSGPDLEGNTLDLYGGYRYTFRPEAREIHPYLGAGVALIRAEVEADGPGPNQSDDDSSAGAYARAGINFDIGERTRLGLDYRHMFLTDVNIGPIGNADFDQVMLTLGFGF